MLNMSIIKLNLKRSLFMFLAMVLVVSLLVGCGGGEEEKPTIKLVDAQWESLWINNAIAQFIIEKGYGYPVEIIQMTTAIAQVSLASGEVDLHMELWQQNWIDNYNEQVAKGTIVNLGMSNEGGPQFWVIPQWVHEEYGINTVADMKDHWELFPDPEDPSKGAFYNCIIGWQCEVINAIKMEAYGLTDYYNIVTPGSAGALDAALEGPMMKEEPVFGYYWGPTALKARYDWYILEEPEYSDAIWEKVAAAQADDSLRPIDEACAYETLPIDKGMNPQLQDKAPDVVTMLKQLNIGSYPLFHTTNWANENEIQDYELAAVWYLNEYENDWKNWVTTEAYDKIKEALDNYEGMP